MGERGLTRREMLAASASAVVLGALPPAELAAAPPPREAPPRRPPEAIGVLLAVRVHSASAVLPGSQGDRLQRGGPAAAGTVARGGGGRAGLLDGLPHRTPGFPHHRVQRPGEPRHAAPRTRGDAAASGGGRRAQRDRDVRQPARPCRRCRAGRLHRGAEPDQGAGRGIGGHHLHGVAQQPGGPRRLHGRSVGVRCRRSSRR